MALAYRNMTLCTQSQTHIHTHNIHTPALTHLHTHPHIHTLSEEEVGSQTDMDTAYMYLSSMLLELSMHMIVFAHELT